MRGALLVMVLVALRGDGALVAMEEAALRAAQEQRFCDASFIFLQLYGKAHADLALYRAAETAFAADDRQLALRLYSSLLQNHPAAEKRPIAEQRTRDLKRLLAESGAGSSCALPPKLCGDWIVSPGEACDDGNLVDGDGCDAACVPTGCGNGVKAPGEQCDDGNLAEGDACTATCTAPAPAVERASPWPWVVLGSGAVALLGGAAAGAMGTQPVLAHGAARADIEAAEAAIDADPSAALQDARNAQARQSQASADWSAWGLPLVVSGAVVAGLGAVGVGVGAWLLATEAE